MVKDFLRSEDYLNIMRFLESMRVVEDNFSMQILTLLNNIFGFKKCDFWLDDGNGNFVCSASTIGDNFVNEYLKYYTKFDVFHPQNTDVSNAIKSRAIHYTNVISPDSHDNIDYCKFLNKYGINREMVVYLSNNNKFIGSIAIGRSQNENDYNLRELTTVKILSKYISQGLYAHQLYMENIYEKKIFESFANDSLTGLVICDQSLKIYYCNESAKDICHELLVNERSINNLMEYFIETVLSECRSSWKIGYQNTFYTSSFKRVRINVLPTVMGSSGINGKNRFIILLSYEDSIGQNNFNLNQSPAQRLTVREGQILNLIIQGKTNQEISQELYISIHTVKKYIRILFDKFNVKNRTGLTYMAKNMFN